ncbi:MAG: hypothetical protein K9L78_02995, partial [Victivallales bacterium]|nr:hypothetical protein [Victivallales bacterium]
MKNNDGHLIIGASTVNSDLLYKVGVSVPDPIIYFKISDKEGVVVKRLEYERFKKSIKDNIPVFLPQDIVENSCAVPDEVKVLEEIIKKYKVQSFEVQKKFPIYYADLLRKLGVELKIAKGDFFPERKIKTKSEID